MSALAPLPLGLAKLPTAPGLFDDGDAFTASTRKPNSHEKKRKRTNIKTTLSADQSSVLTVLYVECYL